jgi:hydrogenase 3 maturation protease
MIHDKTVIIDLEKGARFLMTAKELDETKPRVWGVGNVLLGDDGVGCRVAELLSEGRMSGVVLCGTTPENYVTTLRGSSPRVLLIVDAANMGLAPGECRRLSVWELSAVMDSSHGIPLSVLLEPFMDSLEVVVLGIQPSTLGLGAPLSEAVEKAAYRVADLILRDEWREVESLGSERKISTTLIQRDESPSPTSCS